jgi:hypothetical protein
MLTRSAADAAYQTDADRRGSGVVREVYEEIQQIRSRGRVSNLFKGCAAYWVLLRVNWESMKLLMGNGSLSKKLVAHPRVRWRLPTAIARNAT